MFSLVWRFELLRVTDSTSLGSYSLHIVRSVQILPFQLHHPAEKMPRKKRKQPSEDNVSTTSLTGAEQAKVLEEKRRAVAILAQVKHTNPAPATPPSVLAQPIVVDITSPLSAGVSPCLPTFDHSRLRERVSPHLPPFDHARLRELVQYKSYADKDDDDCSDKTTMTTILTLTTTLATTLTMTVFPWPVSSTRTMMGGGNALRIV